MRMELFTLNVSSCQVRHNFRIRLCYTVISDQLSIISPGILNVLDRYSYMITYQVYTLDKHWLMIYQFLTPPPGNERYFSFSVGMVHFVAVSTDESIDAESTQGQWFKVRVSLVEI